MDWISLLILLLNSALIDGEILSNDSLNLNKIEMKLEPIAGTPFHKVWTINKGVNWFTNNEHNQPGCVGEAPCENLTTNYCLGTKLPYDKTSTGIVHMYFHSQEKIQRRLELYKELALLPKCWAVIQPLLCATFMPKCEAINGKEMVYLPSYEMCKVIQEPCALLYNTSFFPPFLRCDARLFPPKCDNVIRELKFNTTGKCISPLIHTEKSSHFYEGIIGCGLPCKDPLYTDEEHTQIHRLIAWGAGISLALNLFTVATFMADWKSANKYPALIIFYINVCFAVASMGWLAQFGIGSREDIVCAKDGTRRRGEPSAEENLSCVVVFVLVYYFMMAACVWFVIFTYAWFTSFKAVVKMQDRIDKKAAYFHLVAWSLPLVLTISTMASGEVDGSSVTGICFVGYINHPVRAALLLAPLCVVLLLAVYFLVRGVWTLIDVRVKSRHVISPRASRKIRQTIMRCSLTAILVAVFICVTVACHVYEFRNSQLWNDAFRNHIVCRLTRALDEGSCTIGPRPAVTVLQLQLLCTFSAGALMASWVWTPTAAAAWRRYLARRFGCESVERRAHKHELIARAWERRGVLAARGRLSLSLAASAPDPTALQLRPLQPTDTKADSGELSSTWAANLPRFVSRRGALVSPPALTHSLSSTADRRNSQDSQISFSLRHVSVESRRNSLDSQLSVKIAEVKTKVGRRRSKHKSSRRRAARRDSTPSIESQIGRYVLQAFASSTEP